MKKNFPPLRRLSRLKLIIGTLALVMLLGATWAVYENRQESQAAKQTLAEINSSIDQQVADQILGRSQSEKEVGNTSQQSTVPAGSTETSQPSSPSSTQTSTSGAPAPSNGQTTPQKTTPSTDSSPTSPTYPSDTGDTPQVTLTNPGYWKQIVSGSFTATATASDSSGVNRVVFMLRKIGQAMPVQMITDTEAPYSAVIDVSGLPNGDSDYAVEAQVFDNAAKGNMASYRINIQN